MRGDGAGEDVDGDWPPPDERIDGDDDGDRRDVSPTEQLRWSPRLVPPRFRLKTAVLRPESFLLIFSTAKDFI